MQTEVSQSPTNFPGNLLEELEVLRDRADKLRGAASKKANQQANELTDWLERLEFQTQIAGTDQEQRASGAQLLLKKAWEELEQSVRHASSEVQNQLEASSNRNH